MYYIEVRVRDRLRNFRWRLVVVYGPADHSCSGDFLEELQGYCQNSCLAIVLVEQYKGVQTRGRV